MFAMQTEAKAALEHATNKMPKYYDHHHHHAPSYKIGDCIWLNASHYSMDCPTKKLDHKWLGPFTIIEIISCSTTKLQFSAKEKGIHPIVSSLTSNLLSLTPPLTTHKMHYLVQPLYMDRKSTKLSKS